MDEQAVLAADLGGKLPRRLDDRQALDVADRAADLDDRHIITGFAFSDPVFDLIGDMRDHLDGAALIIALALFLDNRPVDASGCHIAVLGQALVDEPFIMAKVEIGFRTVIRDIHFTVLVRVHGPRIDIQVRIEFLHRNPDPPGLEQAAQRRGRDPPCPIRKRHRR